MEIVGNDKVVDVEAAAETPLDEWLRTATVPKLPVTRISADFYDAPSENIPYLCRYMAGTVVAKLRATGLFGDDPYVTFTLNSDDLRALVREHAAARFHKKAETG